MRISKLMCFLCASASLLCVSGFAQKNGEVSPVNLGSEKGTTLPGYKQNADDRLKENGGTPIVDVQGSIQTTLKEKTLTPEGQVGQTIQKQQEQQADITSEK